MQSTDFKGTGSGGTPYLVASWPGWLGVLGGIWLIVAPFVLNYSGDNKLLYQDIIGGVVAILLFGYYALAAEMANTSLVRQLVGGIAALGGIWLIVSPFVLNYTATTNAMWNDIIAGAAFVVVGLYTALYHTTHFTHYA
jgi:uncharacterized membrane protein HdeD (DUF308 family)